MDSWAGVNCDVYNVLGSNGLRNKAVYMCMFSVGSYIRWELGVKVVIYILIISLVFPDKYVRMECTMV